MFETDVTEQLRIIGRLEAQMGSAEERLERMEGKIDALTVYVSEQKGGMRIIWAVATAGGILGVSVLKLLSLAVTALRGP
jgi:hypothetical protein